MFDPCITHQNLFNEIKGLEAILSPFSLFCYAFALLPTNPHRPRPHAELEQGRTCGGYGVLCPGHGMACHQYGLAWRSFKYITDVANEEAYKDWATQVSLGQQLFWRWVDAYAT